MMNKSIQTSQTIKRLLSSHNNFYGALPSGFSKESLQHWSVQAWKETEGEEKRKNTSDESQLQILDPYVDLFSHSISNKSIVHLNSSKTYPSSQLLSYFLTSKQFLIERLILSPFYCNNTTTDITKLKINDRYLAWQVRSLAPLEVICSWQINNRIKGFTMIAYDPQLKKVYHGNCINYSLEDIQRSSMVQFVLIPLHVRYAKFLLQGMVEEIEKASRVTN